MSLDSENLPNQEPEVIKINEQPKGFFFSVLWFQKFEGYFQKIPKWAECKETPKKKCRTQHG
jgi:hypothetical protein